MEHCIRNPFPLIGVPFFQES